MEGEYRYINLKIKKEIADTFKENAHKTGGVTMQKMLYELIKMYNSNPEKFILKSEISIKD